MTEEKKPIAMSLFSGAGGCSLGFKRAGYDIVYAMDIDEVAVDTYRINFPETVCEVADITKIDFEKLMNRIGLKSRELDVLIGGPPCQGFSTAGTRFWDDPRNHLLKSYVRALEIIRPKWFIMENVEGLLTTKRGQYVYEAARAFIKLGYAIRIDKIYAQEYGIPQRRKRVFVVGNNIGRKFTLPAPLTYVSGAIYRSSEVTLRHAIGSLPFPKQGENGVVYYEHPSQYEWEKQLRNPDGYVTEHYIPLLNDLYLERIQCLKPGQTMKHLPEHLQHESFKRRAYRRVKDGTPSEKRGGAPSGMKRLIYEEPSLTITGASTREFIHPEQNRPLTLRECARVQTFPDWFRFSGNASQKIQQIGNAIPPSLAQLFAEHISVNYGLTPYNSNGYGKLLGFTLTKATAKSPALEITQKLLVKLQSPRTTVQLNLFGGENENANYDTPIAQCL